MKFPRASGLILHPTSLPGGLGIGDLGPEAYKFVDFLHRAGQTLWQVMPLSPTGYGDSPYQSLSSFAGNPLLISPEKMAEEGMLRKEAFLHPPSFPKNRVDYGKVIEYKIPILKDAYHYFMKSGPQEHREGFQRFCEENAEWLDDYALFTVLKEIHRGAPWSDWAPELARRDPDAMAAARERLHEEIQKHKFIQFVFFHQWSALRWHAGERGVKIIGDIPIFVAYDSADTWSHPELFHLDEHLRPTVVAGVPPDLYSETGQLWGNPLYRWDVMAQDDYAWWISRLRALLKMVDIVRLDHFRGFEAYWEVPAGMPTAQKGRWVKGPGLDFFEKVRQALGDFPLIVEDLGFVTQEVVELREKIGAPGMKVLQFAFDGDPSNPYLPHNYDRISVVYTSTHDSDTARGWFQDAISRKTQKRVLDYIGCGDESEIHWEMIRLAWRSVATFAIAQVQDILGLDNEARMNVPGTLGGNWGWRVLPGALTDDVAERMAHMTNLYGRANRPTKE